MSRRLGPSRKLLSPENGFRKPLYPELLNQNFGKRASSKAVIRAWRVIHACEHARQVLSVVEGQLAAGMHPFIVTPNGAGSAELYLSRQRTEEPRPLSLLR